MFAQDTIRIDNFVNRRGFTQVDPKFFNQISGRYFSFLAAGQDLNAPFVNNISMDLADAKFSLTGAISLNKSHSLLLNVKVSGDKEGTTASLFNDYKTGGNFNGEVALSWKVHTRYKFSSDSRRTNQIKLRQLENENLKRFSEIYSVSIPMADAQNYQALLMLERVYAQSDVLNLKKEYNSYITGKNLGISDFKHTAGVIDIPGTKVQLIIDINNLLTNLTSQEKVDYLNYILRVILDEINKLPNEEFISIYRIYYARFGKLTTAAANPLANISATGPVTDDQIEAIKKANRKLAKPKGPNENLFFDDILALDFLALRYEQRFIAEYAILRNKKYLPLAAYTDAGTARNSLRIEIEKLDKPSTYTQLFTAVDTLITFVEKKKLAIYHSAEWTSVKFGWLSFRQKIGGSILYTFKPDTIVSPNQPLPADGATIKKNQLVTYSSAIEYNHYFWWPKSAAILFNFGIGGERYDNRQSFYDKRDYTEKTAIKDSASLTGRSKDYTKKYTAFIDSAGNGIAPTFGLLLYGNIYAMFGKTKIFGVHTFFDYRNDFDDNERLGIGFGIVGNVANKDGKSVVGIEPYIKFGNVTEKGLKYDADNEGQSEIGITFNVPILTVPKK